MRCRPHARAALKAIGVKAGRFGLFLPALLKPRAAAMRALLWGVQHGLAVPACRRRIVVSLPRRPDWPAGFADAMGWLEAGPVLLRLDIAERVAAELAWATRRGATALPPGLASRFSLKADLLPVVLRRLGFRIVPAGGLAADEYGPPAPAMLLPLRRRRAALAAAQRLQCGRTALRRPGGTEALGGSAIAEQEDRDWQRLDKWLWCARFMRARSDCAALVARGSIRINRQPTDKPMPGCASATC